ncbi:recombinase family protein [Mucilaginibacter sp. X4EP1]|uniref:recombinase family protein n=1 Tax=Mucilaginibacter sp. X4EP1 TaxID=2723092 RepID=UPI003AFFBE64
MNELSVFKAFGKGEKTSVSKGHLAVVYTRVSSASQTENTSLETQRKACLQYAERHGLTILKNFGQTNESATTDERMEFKIMIDFVKKCKDRVSFILVYSLERFSRNENAIWLSTQLRKLGVEVVSVTQPIDTSSPSGVMQQRILMIFNQFDNELRKAKCTAGMKEMLLQGNWPTKPPLGYDSITANGKRTIVPNERGRILRKAFEWKAEENLTCEAIRVRLARNGITLCHQRVADILRNPFYCGLISHRMLDGEIIPGNHEGLISKELFLKVNGILEQNTHGYTIKEENEAIPLKRFLRCDNCNQFLRGYIVKKKNIHYYKCSSCKNNRNANILNQRFAEILEWFALDFPNDALNLIKQQAVATFNQYSKGYMDERAVLQEKHAELNKKILRLEERLMDEEIPSELYYKYMAKYNEEKEVLETELNKATLEMSNLDDCVQHAIDFAINLPKKWLSADYNIKQRLQHLLFPDGISYNRKTDQCRTSRINFVFLYLAYLKQVMTKTKIGIPTLQLEYSNFACLVAGAGLEPTTFGL